MLTSLFAQSEQAATSEEKPVLIKYAEETLSAIGEGAGKAAEFVTGGISSAAGAVAGGAFEAVMKPIAEGLATFTGWVLTSLGSWWTGLSISSIFTNPALRELTSKELALPMVLVMMTSLIVAGVRLAWSGEGRGLRDIAAGLLVFVMVVPSLSFYFVTLTAASDAFSEVVLDRAVITECVLSVPNTGDAADGRSSGDKPAGEKDCRKDSDGDGKQEGRNEVGKAFFLVFGMAAPVAGAKAGTTVGQFLGLAAPPIVPGAAGSGQAAGGAAGGAVGAVAGGAIGLMGALVLVMLILLSSIIQFLMLFMRDAFLICAFVCAPIVAAGAVTPSGMERMKTMMGWIHAAILWKPAVSLMYFIAILVIRIGLNSPVEDSAFKTIAPVLMGFTIMLLTCIAIFPLVRLCLPWVGTMGAGGGAAMTMATSLAATVAPPIFRNTVHRASELVQQGIKHLGNIPRSGHQHAPPSNGGGTVPPADPPGPPLPPPDPPGPPLPPSDQGGHQLPPPAPGSGGNPLPDASPKPPGLPSGGGSAGAIAPALPMAQTNVPVSSAGAATGTSAASSAVAAKAAPAAASAGPVGIAIVAAGAASQKAQEPTMLDHVTYATKSAASTASYAVNAESGRITQHDNHATKPVSEPKNPA